MERKRVEGLADLSLEEQEERTEETRLTQPPGSLDSGQILADASLHPYLIAIGGTLRREAFVLSPAEMRIGRARTCEIRLVDAGVSRVHARIIREERDFFIEDLESGNGTFLNGERIGGRYRLTAGDRIRIGPNVLFRFEWPTEFDDEGTTSQMRILAPDPWDAMSWQSRPSKFLPTYDDPAELASVVEQLRKLPPLVTSWEVERLKAQIAEAQDGKRFLLQGGDCAETYEDCQPGIVTNKLKILLQMSLILTHAARKPVIRVGRLAGQYAKPRSQATEKRGTIELPSYVGDLVNRPAFTASARRHDPKLLLEGYYRASLTLNFIRALCAGGFADLRRPEYFDLTMFERTGPTSNLRAEYTRLARQISEGLYFMRAMGERAFDELTRVEFFTSHEGLNLVYESAQTRTVPHRPGFYCLTTHLPWIGERTREMTSAHVEFFRGITNPIGIKIGPNAVATDVVDMVRVLNPQEEPGKIILIVRMGAGNVPTKLPPIIEAIRRSRCRVLWVTDPMHGNGIVTKSGIKTRDFGAILQELEETFDTHERCGSRIGGTHFELTGEDVTECIGGGLTEADLDTRYLTACDPRLNYRQAIEMAFLIARRIGNSSVRKDSSKPPSNPL